jgi:antitoxin ParD1/3/4
MMGEEVRMATMNISLPDPMKDWVNAQAESGRYANASDYVRDLIRQDQERADKVRQLQALIDQGLASGISEASIDDVLARARKTARQPR